MQISRLFEIIYYLLNHEQVTAKELAQRFEVSTRTIYRDIDALSAAGVPICTFKGKGGGIRLMEQYVLGGSLLSQREQRDILSALQGLEAVGAGDTDRLLGKLTALFRQGTNNWIQVDFSHWGSTRSQLFGLLQAAIQDHKEVAFTYYGSNGEQSERRVRPLQLWFKHRDWYLRAHCLDRDAQRLFRLSRMQNLTVSDRSFSPPPVPLPDPEEEPVLPLSLRVRLRIHPSQAYRIYDEFHPGQVERDEAGYFLVEAAYPDDEWIYGFLLSFSHHLEVLEPPRVQEELCRRAEAILSHYS